MYNYVLYLGFCSMINSLIRLDTSFMRRASFLLNDYRLLGPALQSLLFMECDHKKSTH